MGVRQLQTLIQEHVNDGYIEVALKDECEAFERTHSARPILLIDAMGISSMLIASHKELLCGQRLNKAYERLEQFFQKLSSIAELFFYKDGPVNDLKMAEFSRRQNKSYESSQKIIDKIRQNYSLQEIIESSESITYRSPDFVSGLAMKYGTLKIAFLKECDAEMGQFACRNERVLAILADDSDFLIYPGKWRYFSLRDMDLETLETWEYNRKALREYLKLNDKEMILLSTLNGNDVIHFDETFNFHKSLLRERFNPALRFQALANFIRSSKLLQSANMYQLVAYKIYRKSSKEFVDKIKNSFEFYNIDFETPNFQDELHQFLHENFMAFSYSVLNYKPLSDSFAYSDLQKSANYFETCITLLRKQIGVVLKFKPFRRYEIYTKISHDTPYSLMLFHPIILRGFQPPLKELLNRSQYPQHDTIRFNLLKWLTNEQKSKDIDLESIPKSIFSDIITLTYMVGEGLIDVIEADLVLLTVKYVEENCVPENVEIPNHVNVRAIFISYNFTSCFSKIQTSLEVTGLKDFSKINRFDGVWFHVLYKKHISNPTEIPALLGDFEKYRYYA